MSWKNFMSSILSAFIGFVIGLLIGLIINSILYINQTLYVLVATFSTLLGIYLGIKFNKTKNVYYYIFKPNKINIILSLTISSAMYFFLIIFYRDRDFFNTLNFETINNIPSLLPIAIIISTIYFYPFSALVHFFYKENKKIIPKKTKLVIIALLLLFNPISLYWFTVKKIRMDLNNFYETCGVEILSIYDKSDLKNSGISKGDVIIGIDNIKISTISELETFLKIMSSTREVKVITKDNIFSTYPYLDEQDQQYKLGIKINQKMCEKNNF